MKGIAPILSVVIILAVLATGIGGYFFLQSTNIETTTPKKPEPQNQKSINADLNPPEPSASPTPAPKPAEPKSAGQKPVLQGRIIDVYPENTATIQTTAGSEEIIIATDNILKDLKAGAEIDIYGKQDEQTDLYLASSVKIQPAGTLKFQMPISAINDRKKSAVVIDTSSFMLRFSIPKPAYLILLSPEGQILAPKFAAIPIAAYEVESSELGVEPLTNAQTALNSLQSITIPMMSRGLWAVKFVPLTGADLSTTMYIGTIFPEPKKLSELKGKLWYFNNVKGERIGKIEKVFAACDETCRKNISKKEYFLFGKLAEAAVQQKLFGRTGSPYVLNGYSAADPVDFLGGLTCYNVKASQNESISGSKLELFDWESNAMEMMGLCVNGMNYNVLQIPSFHVID
ncbi:hypothetical protein A2662_04295 [Candidatus Giovannonibacteria bacterium RIFCSPHIGHO2_01_FULL_45_33]|uniref:Uncharacterized protein n=1 Tax=Candidatus Giovannonibacteria bacterium RIFCSPLOWO2_01_FULL_45_34 TaxID=1798351 RepID=A0A1F5WZA3_9BACT|nr:MAG: hypothetical protein A2662_04295 [Candidatus Giovannonibacteria bacterium RIFCSPHIGHO2_01_FULL_45_33]OGF69449.1 MAG: hypothetical protein A3C73_03910 [Candidatus Giovannonibacteria bacterium RIFCSPHIGHO2_02_FULL_44_11]OGF80949.1 MAG: hypothetical protein A2930_02600 [Candidatus Giovannonibacteria bacterium RIFCSPLOWO2_01_FULL_45_34]